jgi:hypothetical protein
MACDGLVAAHDGGSSKATHSHIEIFPPNMSDTGLSKDWAELTPRMGAVVLECGEGHRDTSAAVF